jgi:FkbM family methyltransferase
MKDYSQFGEQFAIFDALRPIVEEPGRWLDIGAWHPTQFSNTRELYELGWHGVAIEPSPGPMLSLLEAYGEDPTVTLIQAAVGLEPGYVTLHVTDDAVTTGSEAEYERWKSTAKFRGRLTVPIITLEEIAHRFGGFQFWNIDAEGISADLFRRAMTLGLYPKCMCVEHDSRTTELLEVATRHGYRCLLCNSTNVVISR